MLRSFVPLKSVVSAQRRLRRCMHSFFFVPYWFFLFRMVCERIDLVVKTDFFVARIIEALYVTASADLWLWYGLTNLCYGRIDAVIHKDNLVVYTSLATLSCQSKFYYTFCSVFFVQFSAAIAGIGWNNALTAAASAFLHLAKHGERCILLPAFLFCQRTFQHAAHRTGRHLCPGIRAVAWLNRSGVFFDLYGSQFECHQC